MNAVKERPILFSGSMVRAILDGRKTQTRRIVPERVLWKQVHESHPAFRHDCTIACPFGNVGDRLWVREAFCLGRPFELRGEAPDGPGRIVRKHYWQPVCYKASVQCPSDYKWTPSIHMPRWASRITLEITGVRVERLNEISEADAIAEGVERQASGFDTVFRNYKKGQQGWTHVARYSFESLWEFINGAGSWAANPWVWVVEFQTIAQR